MLDWGPWGGQRSWTLGRGQSQIQHPKSQIGRAGRRPNWWRRPLRAIHTVLREPDAAEYDLEGVLAWLRRWRANVYAVNGGGLCALYQTEVPFHRQNRYLRGRDLLKEIVDACHGEGIKVVARMDFRGGHRELFEAHPDWFGCDAEGAPKMTTGLYAACPNSPFRNEGFAFAVVHEVLARCRPDGIWENAASFGGRCYCPTCMRKFGDETGYRLPVAENWDDPAWRRYVRWRYECVREHTRRLRDVVKSHGDDKSYGGEFFSYLEGNARENAQDVDEIAPLWDYQMACIFPLTRGSFRSPLLPVPLWRAEEQMKYLRATGGGNYRGSEGAGAEAQTPVMLYGHMDNLSRYTTPAREEVRLWLAGMAAQGGSPWDCSFVGVPPGRWWDRRHDDVFEGFYGFLAKHEDAFRGLESVAEVALVHSQRTQDRFASSDLARDGYITHVRGWELALFARHAQWDVLPPSGLEPEALRRYRAVILPNVACLSDEEAAALRQYVAGGGALLGTLETGCYDAGGGPRDGGALDDVFGVRVPLAPGRAPPDDASPLGKGTAYGGALPDATKSGPARRGAPAPHGARTPPASGRGAGVPSLSSWQAPSASSGQVLGPLPYAYTRLRRRNRLTAGFEGTDVIANEGLVRPVAAVEGAQVHATLVPEIFPQPPDLSYPTLWDNDAPVLVSHRFGKGRAVYFANGTDRLNVTSGHPDHQRLLENALAWALAGAPPLVETDAPEDVHVTLLRQPATGTLSVHLVNYSGARGRPATRPHLLGPIEVALGAPSLKEAPKAAELLVAGTSVEVARERGRIRLVVPSLELYEVVRLRQ